MREAVKATTVKSLIELYPTYLLANVSNTTNAGVLEALHDLFPKVGINTIPGGVEVTGEGVESFHFPFSNEEFYFAVNGIPKFAREQAPK